MIIIDFADFIQISKDQMKKSSQTNRSALMAAG